MDRGELLTAAQMRAIEAEAIRAGRVTGLELMERAGAAVVAAILEEWPAMAAAARRAVVLCGPGNNGGDGFVVARLLHKRGWAVRVFLEGEAARLPADARANYEEWRRLGPVGDYGEFDAAKGDFDLIVDAVFGIGMSRPMPVSAQPDEIAASCCGPEGAVMVAVDMPTGLDADSGQTMEPAFAAHLTVTFHRPKLGHYLARGPAHCGRLVVADIGLAGAPAEAVRLVGPLGPAGPLRKGGWIGPAGQDGTHKFAHGHAMVLAGGPGRGGAARLAARGALRIGAGLVTVGAPPEAMAENAARLDAVMLREIAGARGLEAMLADQRLTAACLGPGLGLDPAKVALVETALKTRRTRHGQSEGLALVLDADALTLIAGDLVLPGLLHGRCILTPHDGEFARLFPDIARRRKGWAGHGAALAKTAAAREAAARMGCVILLKGPDTVIAAPDGSCALHAAAYGREAPWLATAGSGDVLAGFITGLLARGLLPMEAAASAVRLHVDCARRFGPGLVAEDLPEALPGVFRDLGL